MNDNNNSVFGNQTVNPGTNEMPVNNGQNVMGAAPTHAAPGVTPVQAAPAAPEVTPVQAAPTAPEVTPVQEAPADVTATATGTEQTVSQTDNQKTEDEELIKDKKGTTRFIIILFVILIAFVIALPFITNLFN